MSTQELLAQVAAGTLSPEAASKLLPKGNGNGGGQAWRMKVSEKGAITVHGPGMPVQFGCTQYAQGWETILDHADDIRKFIAENAKVLSRK